MNFIKKLFTARVEPEAVKIARAILRKTNLNLTYSTEPDNKFIEKIDSVYSSRFFKGVKYSYEEYSIKVNDDFTKVELVLNTQRKLIEVRVTLKPDWLSTLAWSEVINSKEHKELIEWAESFKLLKEHVLVRIANKKQEEARKTARKVLGILEETT